MSIKVGMVSLGCSKNQVDAERMLYLLEAAGMKIENNPEDCNAIIINTCGFIEAAKTESIENILEFAQLKEEGKLKVVVVTGCLAERYKEEIGKELPEADVILGIGSNDQIVEAINKAMNGERVMEFAEKTELSLEGRRILANESYFSYLKIAEGCDNFCTYCAIPSIRGRFRSRKIEDIVAEAKDLAAMGVTELNVVAQDTTRYGEDNYGRLMLPELLRELVKIPQIKWIRLLYCYPERVTDELIELMATEDKIVKYLDMPLQHSAPNVLKRMNRPKDISAVEALIDKIRERVPGVVLRTTLIAGFPGETQEEFEDLCNFVEKIRFERLGCFAYSLEDGTPAEKLDGHLPEEEKQRRAEIVMEIQMNILDEFSRSLIGKELEVLTEGYDGGLKLYYGRSYMDACDVDTRVYYKSDRNIAPGEYAMVEITDAMDYDVVGREISR